MVSFLLALALSGEAAQNYGHQSQTADVEQVIARYTDGDKPTVTIEARSVTLTNLVDLLKSAGAPFGHVDLPGKTYQFTHYENVAFSDFLKYIAATAKLSVHEYKDGGKKLIALFDLGPLIQGEVQFFKDNDGNFHLRFNGVAVDAVVAAVNTFGEATGKVIVRDTAVGVKSGELDGPNASAVLTKVAAHFRANIDLAGVAQPVDKKPIVDHWPVTFLSGAPPSISVDAEKGTAFSSVTGSGKNNETLSKLAEVFNALYGAGTVTPASNNLIIKGDRKIVDAVKRDMAMWIDVPFPVVQVTSYAFQASEREKDVRQLRNALVIIEQGIQLARSGVPMLSRDISTFAIEGPSDKTTFFRGEKRIFDLLHDFNLISRAGDSPRHWTDFDDRKLGVRSLAETFLYMTLLDRTNIVDNMNRFAGTGSAYLSAMDANRKELIARYKNILEAGNGDESNLIQLERLVDLSQRLYFAGGGSTDCYVGTVLSSRNSDAQSRAKRLDNRLLRSKNAYSSSFFRSVSHLFQDTSHLTRRQDIPYSDVSTVLDFLEEYRNNATEKVGASPERLTILAAKVDDLLKLAMDAYDADVTAAVMRPLIDWVNETAATVSSRKWGLNFVGKTSIAVTSTRGAAIRTTTEGFLPFTPTKKLSADDIAALLKIGESGTVESGDLSRTTVFSSQAVTDLLQFAAEFGEADTTFKTVASGLSMSVRPSVLPGGRGARLQIELRSSVDVSTPSADALKQDSPVDAIKTQSITTDVAVEAYDLFPLATFELQTRSIGDRRWTIPILSGVPLIGTWFMGGRGPEVIDHKSLVVVQTTILPRAMDLARRYVPSTKPD